MPIAKLNGIEINYVDEGEGEALLLVHNVISNISGFAYNIPVLSRHFRTIALDLRGHGKTTAAKSQEEAPSFYTFENIAEDIHQLLRHLGVESCYILGQAYWGATSIFNFFARHPEMVKGIIPVGCNLFATPDGEGFLDQVDDALKADFVRMHDIARTQGMLAVFEERKKLRTFWCDKLMNSPHIMESFRKMYEVTSPLTFINFPVMREAGKQAILAALQKTQVPLMMLMGLDDSRPREMVAAMQRDYPNTHSVLLPDCGHYVAIENPADFNRAVMNFIAGVSAYR